MNHKSVYRTAPAIPGQQAVKGDASFETTTTAEYPLYVILCKSIVELGVSSIYGENLYNYP